MCFYFFHQTNWLILFFHQNNFFVICHIHLYKKQKYKKNIINGRLSFTSIERENDFSILNLGYLFVFIFYGSIICKLSDTFCVNKSSIHYKVVGFISISCSMMKMP